MFILTKMVVNAIIDYYLKIQDKLISKDLKNKE